MKTKILSLLFGVMAVILTACSTDIFPEPTSQNGKGDSILRLEIDKQDITRGNLISSFNEGDRVNIIVRNMEFYHESITTHATYKGGEWKMDQDIYLSGENAMLHGNSFIVWAVYPEIRLESTQFQYDTMEFSNFFNWGSNHIVNEDVLLGNVYITDIAHPTAKITCSHLKPRLTFALKNNSDKSLKVSKLSVENIGKYNFLAETATIDTFFDDYQIKDVIDSFSTNCNISIPAGESADLDFLLLPTYTVYNTMLKDVSENDIEKTILDFSLEVTVPSTGKTTTVKFSIEANAWYSSHQYTYPITLFKKDKRDPIPDTDEYVDLGLSVLWAKRNVGADTTDDLGKFFFWGCTKGWKFGEEYIPNENESFSSMTVSELLDAKVIEPDLRNDDILTHGYWYHLAPTYDAATQNMGSPWRMPTSDEIEELVNNTTMEWAQQGERWIFKLTSTVPGFEDRYIILPGAEGYFSLKGDFHKIENVPGYWWGSTPNDYEHPYSSILSIWWEKPYDLHEEATKKMAWDPRSLGMNIRAVRPIEK